ncbi:DUF6591 domain-containing protein [Bacteroides hominis]|nr:DUF6591 domain-containing protein [Bacteroides fragilis]MDA1492034.1 hypothetical protein [Bacteroides fragilis]
MKVKVFFMVVGALFLASCGGNKQTKSEDKTVELKPYEKKVKGYLSDVFEVVEGTYKMECKRNMFLEGQIQIKIKSIGKGEPSDYGFHDGNHGPLFLTVCNKEGQPIANFTDIPSSFEADGLLKDMVSKEGDENWILFKDFLKDILPEDAATFFITSKKIEKDKRGSLASRNNESEDNDEDDTLSDTGDKKWDKMLDDYEAYADKYITMMKKANDDDSLDALFDYPDLLEKAKKLEKSLKEAETSKSLSSKQVKRMAKIQVKMMNAMSEMNDDSEL